MKKKWSVLIFLAVVFLLLYMLKIPQSIWTARQEGKTVALTFEPVPHTSLEKTDIQISWVLQDTLVAAEMTTSQDIFIRVYSADDMNFLILKDKDSFYDMQFSFAGDLQSLNISVHDNAKGESKELLVSADLGTTVQKSAIYAAEDSGWSRLLEAENLFYTDFNKDGNPTLVAESMGSLPGFVYIYRHNGQRYERANVAKSLDSVYAALITQGEKTLIEASPESIVTRYTYRDWKLIRVK